MVSTKTPAEIYREIQDFPEAENVARYQVYYLWQRANGGLWQRDADPMKSATILLQKMNAIEARMTAFLGRT